MTKIHRKTLAEEVADRINDLIVNGTYQVGEKLPNETDMMASFGVGRSTIREAIKLLANIGILDVRHGVGSFVNELVSSREPIDVRLSKADTRHIDEVRAWLEIKMAEKAAMNRTEADIRSMADVLQRRDHFGKTGQIEQSIDEDLAFHSCMAHATCNPVLEDLYKATAKHVKRYLLDTMRDTTIMTVTQELHAELLDAITRQDCEQAVAAIKEILEY
ncbi:FadR/GntR family transcriptional regulator [Chitinophaga sancti]|uniref:DNA-binding transcriptional regulator, FadR family n=1 Tax=Chitinophaga sancti TaxID=1004 RepID=A0A1K1SV45_9BACT|nr:FadR/GntR family transcriptional regulator [Chitinophaga sancti]WQD63809.1 FadR/GntR family transcriptional regulator [Chitinophaga sancti]WQG90566.1 FadR/GntR family transcriptional regulator [Chitinophaga sancti]SFW88186.1 DNA-binding transcriptional regulator, FadR family [Chitinophaga sancti]